MHFPWKDGKRCCHRDTVGELLLSCAKDRGQQIEVVEWPGGEPVNRSFPVTPDIRKAVRQRRKTVPMGEDVDKDLACLPWASIVTFTSNEKDRHNDRSGQIQRPMVIAGLCAQRK